MTLFISIFCHGNTSCTLVAFLYISAALEENIGNCPVCRKVFHAKDLEHVLNLVGSQSSQLV